MCKLRVVTHPHPTKQIFTDQYCGSEQSSIADAPEMSGASLLHKDDAPLTTSNSQLLW
jgi:hypothetical protein